MVRQSRLYESAPAYVTDQPRFINGALAALTCLQPLELLDALKTIEVSACDFFPSVLSTARTDVLSLGADSCIEIYIQGCACCRALLGATLQASALVLVPWTLTLFSMAMTNWIMRDYAYPILDGRSVHLCRHHCWTCSAAASLHQVRRGMAYTKALPLSANWRAPRKVPITSHTLVFPENIHLCI